MSIKDSKALARLLDEFGDPLNQTQIAKLCGVHRSTVAANPEAYGAIRFGGTFRYFEKLTLELIQEQHKQNIERASLPIPKKKKFSHSVQSKPLNLGRGQHRRIAKPNQSN